MEHLKKSSYQMEMKMRKWNQKNKIREETRTKMMEKLKVL